jgi:hypothetical protein
MRELILPLICLLVVSVCICLPAPATVGKTVEPPAVTRVIQKQYVPIVVQPQPSQPAPAEMPPRCCPNGQCRQYAFPILGAPIRVVGRILLDVRNGIVDRAQARRANEWQCVHEE